MRLSMSPMLYLSLNCTICDSPIHEHPGAATEESIAASKTSCCSTSQPNQYASCPKCGKTVLAWRLGYVPHNGRQITITRPALKLLKEICKEKSYNQTQITNWCAVRSTGKIDIKLVRECLKYIQDYQNELS